MSKSRTGMIKVIKNETKALYCNDDFYIGYRKGKIYKCNLSNDGEEMLCKIPLPFLKRICSKIRILERAIHLDPRTCIKLNERTLLLGLAGYVFRIDIVDGVMVCEHQFASGMSNPLMFLKINGIEGFEDCIVYGEYTNEISNHEVCIYSRGIDLNSEWKKVFSFSSGTVQHIHGFMLHPQYKDSVFMMTGDKDNESAFWRIRNDFRDCVPILIGKQQYRACVSFPYRTGFVYATDNPYEQNHLYYYDYEKNELHNLLDLSGTVINGIERSDIGLFSTTVESRPFLRKWDVLFPQPLADGVKCKNVEVFRFDKSTGDVEKVCEFKKDFLYMPLFQFGLVSFCQSDSSVVLINPTAVKSYDNKVLLVSER